MILPNRAIILAKLLCAESYLLPKLKLQGFQRGSGPLCNQPGVINPPEYLEQNNIGTENIFTSRRTTNSFYDLIF